MESLDEVCAAELSQEMEFLNSENIKKFHDIFLTGIALPTVHSFLHINILGMSFAYIAMAVVEFF